MNVAVDQVLSRRKSLLQLLNLSMNPFSTDFDHDGDGYVSFKEYAEQMALQAQKAEQDQLYGNGKDKQKNKALQDLYKDAAKGSGNQYKNLYV